MAGNNIGSLLVTSGDDLLGILTVEDVIARVIAKAISADDITVGETMTKDLVVASPKMDVVEAMNLMRDHDIKHLPVLEKKKLVGFLTMKDVVKVEPELFEILLDTIELREEERKLAFRTGLSTSEGFCEVCGNFSEHLNRGHDRRLSCPDCQPDEEDL